MSIVVNKIHAVRVLSHKNSQDPLLKSKDLLKFSSISPPRTNARIRGGIGKSYNLKNVATTAITAAAISRCSKYTAPSKISSALEPVGKPNSSVIITLGTPPNNHCAPPIITNVRPIVDIKRILGS